MVGKKKGGGHDHGHSHPHKHSHGVRREDTDGAKTMAKLARISQKKQGEDVRRSLELGLKAADSIVDRNISLFSRAHQPAFAGINTFMSFDIDSIDPGFAPGTGSPEPGGLLPREAFEMIHTFAAEGLCGMEVVEVSPPYDVNDNTAQLACRVILDVLGTLVSSGHLGHRSKVMKPEGKS